MSNQLIGNHGLGIFFVIRFDLWPLFQGQMRIAKINSAYISLICVPRGFAMSYQPTPGIMDYESFDMVRFHLWLLQG